MELNQRWGYNVVLDGSEKEIDHAINEHEHVYKTHFRKFWSSHQCGENGCGRWLVCDGGMKPHRVVCTAKFSAIRTYKHCNVKTIVGCNNKPGNDSEFCFEHKTERGPVILAEPMTVAAFWVLVKTFRPFFILFYII